MQSFNLNLGQTKNIAATPADGNGNAALLDTSIPAATSSDPTIVSVVASADGLTLSITGNKPGTATITEAGRNSNHTGIQSQFSAVVAEVPATQFLFSEV